MENKKPDHIPAFHKNLPFNAINQVVFYGNESFNDCHTLLLLQPEKTWNFSFIYSDNDSLEDIKDQAEFCVAKCLMEAAPANYVLLAINPKGLPKNKFHRDNGFYAFFFLFVEKDAFEFRENLPEGETLPQKLEIKTLENGLQFYSDASYLIWNKENEINCGKCLDTGEIALSSTHYADCPNCKRN